MTLTPSPPTPPIEKSIWRCFMLMFATSAGALQVLCPCAKRKERREEAEPLDDESSEDPDTNTLGLSAQDLRDPAAIVSPRSPLRPAPGTFSPLRMCFGPRGGYGRVFVLSLRRCWPSRRGSTRRRRHY